MKLRDIARLLGHPVTAGGTAMVQFEREPVGYSIDTRTLRAGELFFAVRGEHHDGHRFVEDALNKGAMAAVVSHEWQPPESIESARLIRVNDPLLALQVLASSLLREWNGRLIAITGSMGKTTTKEMTAAALSSRGRVNRTVGNLNNAYGLPLSVLRMESDGSRVSDFDFAVLEMGMNHKGELARLVQIAPPDIGIVTNVAPVHLEFFDSVDDIAHAKSELVIGIKPGGVAVLNADDERVAGMRHLRSDIGHRSFGINKPADVMAKNIESAGLAGFRFELVTPHGKINANLRVSGRHNLINALAAAAVADLVDIPLERIAKSLAELTSQKMRGEILVFKSGFTLIDDSYNSNPEALVEMVGTLGTATGFRRRIIVCGEMLELGSAGPRLHSEAGGSIAGCGIDLLIGIRGLAREMVSGARQAGMDANAAIFFETPEEASDFLTKEIGEGDLILVKGSRGVKTEAVVERVKQLFELMAQAKTEKRVS